MWGALAVIDYRLLGPIEAGVDGRLLDIGGRKQRALLAILLLNANEPVSRDCLAERLWGEHPPAGAQHTLEVYVSRLRKALGPAAGYDVVLTRPGAYLLRTADDRIDVHYFERLAGEGRRALAAGEPERAAADLRAALALWRGAPLSGAGDELFAQAEIARLEELRAGVIEDRIEAELALGGHSDVIGELGALVAAHPLRERLYQLLMIALYRCGRQPEALAVYQSARRVLVAELGIEPSPALQRVERAILAQDASLEAPPRAEPAPAPAAGGRHLPPASGSRRAQVLVAAGAGLALVVALLASGALAGRRGSSGPVAAEPDTVAVIDVGRNVLAGDVTGVGRPGGIAHGASATWVTDTADDLLRGLTQRGRWWTGSRWAAGPPG